MSRRETCGLALVGLLLGGGELHANPAAPAASDHEVQMLRVPPSARPGLTRMSPAQTGIVFTNLLAESRYLTNQIYQIGRASCRERV